MIDKAKEFNIAFDVLDAAILRCLKMMPHGFVEFIRQETTHASVVYSLFQYQLGDVGEIRIDKLADLLTKVFFIEPDQIPKKICPRADKKPRCRKNKFGKHIYSSNC